LGGRLGAGSLIAIGVLAFIGLVFGGIAGVTGFNSWKFTNEGATTRAEVVSLLEHYDSQTGYSYEPVFRYQYGGINYESRSGISSSPPAFNVGDNVDIYVDADDPERVRADRFVDLWLLPLIFGGVAGILLGVAFIVGIFTNDNVQTVKY
jgi:hypothetical protein